MISVQGLDILDLECLEVEVVQAEDSYRVLEVEAQHEGFKEVRSFLDRTNILSGLGSLKNIKE
jgi:hypothetical protein